MASTRRSRFLADASKISDDEIYEADGTTVRDGKSVRVPYRLMDANSFDPPSRSVMVDAASHRPGFRTLVEDGSGSTRDAAAHVARLGRQRTADAYAAYDTAASRAYLGDDVEPDDDNALPKGTPYVGGREGTACSLNGRPGVLRTGRDGQLYCFVGADSVTDSRDQMYRIYDAKKSREYLSIYPDDDEDDVDAAVEATQSRPNRPNRSAPRSDSRSVDQMRRDHTSRMEQEVYSHYDAQLRDAYKEF